MVAEQLEVGHEVWLTLEEGKETVEKEVIGREIIDILLVKIEMTKELAVHLVEVVDCKFPVLLDLEWDENVHEVLWERIKLIVAIVEAVIEQVKPEMVVAVRHRAVQGR